MTQNVGMVLKFMTYVWRIITHANCPSCHLQSIALLRNQVMDSEDPMQIIKKFFGILQTTADTKCKELSYCLFRTEFWYFSTDQDICLLRPNAMSIGGEGEGGYEHITCSKCRQNTSKYSWSMWNQIPEDFTLLVSCCFTDITKLPLQRN